MTASEGESRSREDYEADKAYEPDEGEDWSKLEGQAKVEQAWQKYLEEHPEVKVMDQAEQDQRRDEIAQQVAKEHGFDLLSDEKSAHEHAA